MQKQRGVKRRRAEGVLLNPLSPEKVIRFVPGLSVLLLGMGKLSESEKTARSILNNRVFRDMVRTQALINHGFPKDNIVGIVDPAVVHAPTGVIATDWNTQLRFRRSVSNTLPENAKFDVICDDWFFIPLAWTKYHSKMKMLNIAWLGQTYLRVGGAVYIQMHPLILLALKDRSVWEALWRVFDWKLVHSKDYEDPLLTANPLWDSSLLTPPNDRTWKLMGIPEAQRRELHELTLQYARDQHWRHIYAIKQDLSGLCERLQDALKLSVDDDYVFLVLVRRPDDVFEKYTPFTMY